MHFPFELLNVWGDRWAGAAFAGFWQSSVLIAVLWVGERLFRRRLRPALRYALWMLVLVKMLLPASFALPTGVGYWIPWGRGSEAQGRHAGWVARDLPNLSPTGPDMTASAAARSTAQTPLRLTGLLALGWLVGAIGFAGAVAWRTLRWQSPGRSDTATTETLGLQLEASRVELGLARGVEIRWIDKGQSPALCGLWRLKLLLPRGLANRLSRQQWRAVFLHELVHARRGDVWIHALQVVVQVLWWWHPLLWLANARLRAIREEVVDDEVAYRMGPDALAYPEALLEVAKASLFGSGLSLGLLGIAESRSALRGRIERLLVDPPTQLPRLGVRGLVVTVLLGLLLLPMAGARSSGSETHPTPRRPVGEVTARTSSLMARGPEAQVAKAPALLEEPSTLPQQVVIEARFLELSESAFAALPLGGKPTHGGSPHDAPSPWALSESQRRVLLDAVKRRSDVRGLGTPRVTTLSGRSAEIRQSETDTNSPISLGVLVRPEVLLDRRSIQLQTRVEWTQRVPPDFLTSGKDVGTKENAAADESAGLVYSVHVEGYIRREATNTIVLSDGGCQVLGDLGPTQQIRGSKRMLVLVQATLIDPAGNRLYPAGK